MNIRQEDIFKNTLLEEISTLTTILENLEINNQNKNKIINTTKKLIKANNYLSNNKVQDTIQVLATIKMP